MEQVNTVSEALAQMDAPKVLETQAFWEGQLGKLLDKAKARHEELVAAGGNWRPGEPCEDAVLSAKKFDVALMALDVVVQCELQMDARYVERERRSNENDPLD